ncbi:MAG: PRC-barrel domain-containing protein [Bacteroidales bacterium]|jgi:hypothetical protein
MKRSLRDIIGYTISTKDESSGRATDFLFDEKQWVIRYLEADFGNLFTTNKVLIPRLFLKEPIWEKGRFPVDLLDDEIKRCPKLEDHQTVSRKYEEELFEHYQINPYWVAYIGAHGTYFPPRPIRIPSKVVDEEKIDSILRSFEEIEGYHIHALDGRIGHIQDLIIDDADWQVVYAVVDTSNWLPWSKKVLVSVDRMDKISYVNREVHIKMRTAMIKNAPVYDPSVIIDNKFEQEVLNFYNLSMVT